MITAALSRCLGCMDLIGESVESGAVNATSVSVRMSGFSIPSNSKIRNICDSQTGTSFCTILHSNVLSISK